MSKKSKKQTQVSGKKSKKHMKLAKKVMVNKPLKKEKQDGK